ncbi:LamG-like jellyroll fold domain-containing protein [Bacillus badius]|uniref:LamG-like jellyroll fold domain-containing protein n=1 Tax=Bacillus badius TaxID=1455 RepID=UPI000597A2F5|nr:LamG-like jellyroll fold domain-containing protein [Bacillus badius]KIL74632.1 hypothetical protein SD78_1701 [Bacillus badius]
MNKSRAILSSTLALFMLGQSSVLAESQVVKETSFSQQVTEIEKAEGLIFDPAKSNSVQLNKILENAPSTYEMLVKCDLNPNQRQILFGNFKSGNKTAFNIEITADNQLRYFEMNESGTIDKKTVGANITTGKWTHLAVVRDTANKKVTFIQDGKVIAAFENVNLAEELAFENYHSIGKDTRDQYHPKAEIKEVRLWNAIRTLDEIKENTNTSIKGNEEGLMHTWILDDSIYYGLNIIRDKAGKIDGTAFGFQKEYVIETPYKSEFKGTGIDFTKGELEIATDEPITEAPRTVEAWVKVPADISKHQRIGNIIGNFYHEYYKDKSRFNFEITSNGNPRIYWQAHTAHTLDYTANVNVNVGDWVHVAMVLDDEQNIGTTYINGEKIIEQYTNAPIPNIPPREELKIGSDYRGYAADGKPELNFNGEIADVRLWSTIRTPQEIKANYNNTLEGDEKGLIGNWKLDDAKGGVYPDHSKKKNHGYEYDNETSNWIEPDFAKGDYSIAVIPDTQNFVQHFPNEFKNYMNWFKGNADDLNLKLVMQVGDLVNNPGSIKEWQTVQEGMSYLDGVVPYVFVPGNHDYNNQYNRTTTYYNQYFPYEKYSKASTFGGAFVEGKMENTYSYFDINGVEYMVINLEYGPRDEVLEWANQLAEENADKKIIINTHSYLYHNGEHQTLAHMDDPGSYISDANNGDQIWDKFVRKHENIILVTAGHIGSEDLVVREDIGDHGNSIKQVLVDAQFMQPYDLGMVMLMTFKEGSNDVEVNWYSIKKDKFLRADNQFTTKLNIYDKENSKKFIGDVNGDNVIDIKDAFFLKNHIHKPGKRPEKADINQDGIIDAMDMKIIVQNYLSVNEQADNAPVPQEKQGGKTLEDILEELGLSNLLN